MLVRSRCLAALMVLAMPLSAQADPLAEGIAAMQRHDLPRARTMLETTLQRDPGSYAANWRLAHVLLDQGKVIPDSVQSPPRDTLYLMAVSYARRAVAANPEGAGGHFVLANALGRHSLSQGTRERVKAAMEIRTEALRALALDPTHSGAYHVLGRWHAEVERLSGLKRFVAEEVLGGGILETASWEEAERNMRLAVQHGPARIYHRLDLAHVLLDRDKPGEAREQLEAIGRMTPDEPMDVEYQREAAALLKRIGERRPS